MIRWAGTLIIYFPRGFTLTVFNKFVENTNETFFVLFNEKLSFPEDVVSIRAVEMYIQGEQPTSAKLKIIIMGHRGIAGFNFFFFLSYNQGQKGRTKNLFQVLFHVRLK